MPDFSEILSYTFGLTDCQKFMCVLTGANIKDIGRRGIPGELLVVEVVVVVV